MCLHQKPSVDKSLCFVCEKEKQAPKGSNDFERYLDRFDGGTCSRV
jgi:hypothetical protein